MARQFYHPFCWCLSLLDLRPGSWALQQNHQPVRLMPTAVNQKNALDTQLVFCAIGEVSYHKINCFRECTKLQTNKGRRLEFQLMGARCLMSHWEFQLMLQITFQPLFSTKIDRCNQTFTKIDGCNCTNRTHTIDAPVNKRG